MKLLEQKWDEILLKVKNEHELTDISFNTWLKPLKIYTVSDNCIYILVPIEHDQLGRNYITRKYLLPLKVAIAELTGTEYAVELVLPDDAKKIASPVIKKKESAQED